MRSILLLLLFIETINCFNIIPNLSRRNLCLSIASLYYNKIIVTPSKFIFPDYGISSKLVIERLMKNLDKKDGIKYLRDEISENNPMKNYTSKESLNIIMNSKYAILFGDFKEYSVEESIKKNNNKEFVDIIITSRFRDYMKYGYEYTDLYKIPGTLNDYAIFIRFELVLENNKWKIETCYLIQ